jgi:type I restriction enzyme, S subunit
MSDLPKGWVETKLGEVCKIQVGRKDANHGNPIGKYNFFTCAAEPLKSDTYSFEGESLILPGNGANVGLVIYYSEKFEAYQRTYVINNLIINGKYIFYFLQSFWKQSLEGKQYGSATNYIRLANVTDFNILIPPLDEQRRIVAKLDTLFSHTRKAREELDRIPDLIKRYKQAVLSAACSGKLTEDWRRENLGSESPWYSTTLSELIIDKPKNGYSVKPVNYETPFRVVTLTATTSGKFNAKHFKYFDESIETGSQFWLQPNDILVQRGNTIDYVGVSAIYDGNPNQFIFPDLMMRLRAKPNVMTKYLHMVLSCEKSRKYLRDKATGTAGTMPKINQPTLISLPVSLPPLEEQQEIVKRVEEKFKAIEQMDAQYQKASKLLDRLEQATLSKAFRGELVPQDPNDEPASVLLERILAEKQPKKKAEPRK